MSVTADEGVFIQLDDRRRVALGKLGHHSRYLGRELPDGTVILSPAIVITELERSLLERPEEVAKVNEALGRADRGVPRRTKRPSPRP